MPPRSPPGSATRLGIYLGFIKTRFERIKSQESRIRTIKQVFAFFCPGSWFLILGSQKAYLCAMRFDLITVLPDLLVSPFAHSILQRAQKKGIAEIHVHNLRDYATNKQKSVDDYPYGGGSGMVMTIEPFARCIEQLKSERE